MTQSSILQKRIIGKRYQVMCLVGGMEALDSQVQLLQRGRRGKHATIRLPCAPQAPPGAVHSTRWTMLRYNLSAPNIQVNVGDLVCCHPDPSMF